MDEIGIFYESPISYLSDAFDLTEFWPSKPEIFQYLWGDPSKLPILLINANVQSTKSTFPTCLLSPMFFNEILCDQGSWCCFRIAHLSGNSVEEKYQFPIKNPGHYDWLIGRSRIFGPRTRELWFLLRFVIFRCEQQVWAHNYINNSCSQ